MSNLSVEDISLMLRLLKKMSDKYSGNQKPVSTEILLASYTMDWVFIVRFKENWFVIVQLFLNHRA